MKIYKNYDKTTLDYQYNTRLQVPDFANYFEGWEARSEEIRKQYAFRRNAHYGNHPRERLDIFPSSLPASKTLIFIHGGYWQKLDKDLFHFIATAFVPYHITTVFITYPLAPEASMDEIVISCRNAVQWVQSNISQYNGDPNELYIAGHSAGGHLATMMMSKEWSGIEMIKGVCAISGLFNLLPIQLSELNEVLHMDEETAVRNSPVRWQPLISCPVIVAVGDEESDEFKEQGEELYNCWNKIVSVQLLKLPGINHYSIADEFGRKNSLLHVTMLKMMGIDLDSFQL
ncbi:MAG: alpha/beta hydrolase [Chitinophagaceae bacterium]